MLSILTATLALLTNSVDDLGSKIADETLAPVSEVIILGSERSGGNLASWAANDGNNRRVCEFIVPYMSDSPFIRIYLNYTTSQQTPSAISFNVKIAVDPLGVQNIILKMQDKTTNIFVNTSVVREPTVTGSTYNGVLTGTLSDYVGGDGRMTGMIEIRRLGLRSSRYPCIEFDSGLLVVSD